MTVASFLLPESVLALGLVSKDFLHLVPSAQSQLRGNAVVKQSFLLLLENDLPDRLLCYSCNRLYNWRIASGQLSFYRCSCLARYQDSFPHPAYLGLCDCTRVASLQREVGDLILRADKKGPEYGLPVSHIAHECLVSQCYGTLRTPISNKLQSKIVAASLMLWRVKKLKFTLPLAYLSSLMDFERVAALTFRVRSQL